MTRKRNQKQFETMSFEEMMELPREEFMDSMEQLQNRHLQEMTDLGDPKYPGYTFEEKVEFWKSSLHRQMRKQAESGLNEYDIFSYQWYQAVIKLEPQFEQIMAQVFKSAVFEEWNRDEFLNRIKKE